MPVYDAPAMDGGPAGPALTAGSVGHQRLAHALTGTCGAPYADAVRQLRESASAALAAAREQRATLAAATAQAQLAAALGADDDLAAAARHRASATTLLARVATGPPAERRVALLWLAVVDWSALGDVRTARDRLARAAVLAGGDEPPQIALPVLVLRAIVSTLAGDLTGAARTARDALAQARDCGDPALLAIALAAQVQQLSARGERAAALAAAERLLELRAQAGGGGRSTADAPTDEGAQPGDATPTDASARPDASVAPTDARNGELRATLDAIAAWAAGPALLNAGDAERGAALVTAATTPQRLARLLPQARSVLLDAGVQCAVARDDADDAHVQLQALEQLAFAQRPLGAAVAGSAAALVALADDRPINAEARATGAAEQARRAPSRLLELRATLLAGRAQAALGAPEVAAERFAEAEEVARGLGAHARAEQALRERRALGGRDDEPPSTEAYGLTPRQLEIARLVAEGATNRQVAGQLGISEHTVNTHLRVAFARLGVTRRTALATALDERAGGERHD
ncbi:helix-turn-helix transcriptional regulator [Conexibacter sp. CPCC 206217]|uniref:helix-turn-helix domain-containing protein n=1 Tax=Conexibacter sp. CPCC 206217 TaxID=3064574 RepID=UPI0027181CEC|nr:helix-turn-helix transcriptional regulator [Conexibacter sp. CPCC 206217]MDO8211292.1 helix-turn-helix transcriptional regulator [Conexibacter sp. CPCC 206217]